MTALAALAVGLGVLIGLGDWPGRFTLELTGVLAAAVLVGALAARPAADDWTTVPPFFVVDFGALLLLGPFAAVLVALAGRAADWLTGPHPTQPAGRRALHVATTILALLVAGMVHSILGGTFGRFAWPWDAAPLAATLVAHGLLTSAEPYVFAPLLAGRPADPAWLEHVRRGAPGYVLGAGLAVGLAEVVDRQLWQAAPVVAVPLYAAYRLYCVHLARLEDECRRRQAMAAIDHGMAILDRQGRITLWNDALERLLGCPRERAMHRQLPEAVSVIGEPQLARAVRDALRHRPHQALVHVGLPGDDDLRVLQVRILPIPGGVTLLWHDATERTRAEQALKRREARLALAAEGANDGMWEWDLGSEEFYATARWRAMLGLPEHAGIGHPSDWMDRVHPDDLGPLQAALDAHLEGRTLHVEHEHRVRHEDGSYRRFLCRGIGARDAAGRVARLAGSLTDTTEQESALTRVLNVGALDPLTGLGNRAVFVERLGRRLDQLKHRSAGRFAVLYLDLDRFKVVNDSLGHLVGDELLTAVSRRLESCLRDGDALARLGGDEFAILLNELSDDNQANAIAFRIQDTLAAPFALSGRQVFVSVSIGIAFGGAQYTSPDEIMRDADTAMYHAKSHGKARHEVFDADMHARELDRFGLENDLRDAVAHRDFEIVYQPIVSLATGLCVGFESLIRWTRHGTATSPAKFIPIAEELGLIEPIGTWVLQQACTTFADWKRRHPENGLECITVNVSSRQLMQQNFPMIVEQAIDDAGLEPGDLRLEITETALMDSPTLAAELLRQLRDIGVKIYLDDFGTGYSSLSHLHRLPVDALKIDQSFVKSLLVPDRPAIVESILALARTLNTTVVAEGIETETQARELRRLGCTWAQGYLFSRPLAMRDVEALLRANHPLGPAAPAAGRAVVPEDDDFPTTPFQWPKDWLTPPGDDGRTTPP